MAVIAPGEITQTWFGQQVRIYDTSIAQLVSVASVRPSLSV
jgi:hypothetical protein